MQLFLETIDKKPYNVKKKNPKEGIRHQSPTPPCDHTPACTDNVLHYFGTI